jgi:hypothetical protein
MVWNSETNQDDLVSDITFFTDADTIAYPLADRARNANRGLDRVVQLILKSDGHWEWDDTVQSTELLDVSTALVSGTQKYAIGITWLKIGKVRIKDSAGNWISLTPKDRKLLTDAELTASASTPKYYDRMGNFIYLYPKPNYASTGGLEIQYQRGAAYFVPGDTTKTPGFASHFHRLISLYSALDYCEVNDMEKRASKIQAKIKLLEEELVAHYADRSGDDQPAMRVQKEDFGERALI